MGARAALVTFSAQAIGRMSCNPAIGGIAKGQLVREIDALGGEMGLAADRAGIHFRMLNTSKGPAMHSPRAQADKYLYSENQQRVVADSGCAIVEGEAVEILEAGSKLVGLLLADGRRLLARSVIIASGTFMDGLIHRGCVRTPAGRIGEPPSQGLPRALRRLGFVTARLKTGTPPRVRAGSLDNSRFEIQLQDAAPRPFSFRTARLERPHLPCYIAWTTEATRRLILEHRAEIPLYNGQITGIGPRYCPSIEDKVCRFADKERHQIFIEPESERSDEIYLNGISTSMGEELQLAMLRTIPGLERAEVLRYGYAIEYDFCPPHQILPTMRTRAVPGLYFAGQINGTTGYEEAAAQGLLAGINSVLALRGEAPLVLGRDEAYIGVLSDDLVTKEITEPYRMFTSRAEHRLILRSDNADERLMGHGRRLGLISAEIHEDLLRRVERRRKIRDEIGRFYVEGVSGATILRRPEMRLGELAKLPGAPASLAALPPEEGERLEVDVKYEGYLEREHARVVRMKRLEDQRLPQNIDYLQLRELGNEARQKLQRFRPVSLGQAGRIAGVNPADLQILEVYLKRRRWPLLDSQIEVRSVG